VIAALSIALVRATGHRWPYYERRFACAYVKAAVQKAVSAPAGWCYVRFWFATVPDQTLANLGEIEVG